MEFQNSGILELGASEKSGTRRGMDRFAVRRLHALDSLQSNCMHLQKCMHLYGCIMLHIHLYTALVYCACYALELHSIQVC